ncbi:MAG: fluoride efflux transporter CrcB [Kiritimatiellae bacterium]|nr:fluoride efflux transporter CrcB [Kiritimatiellia bacterium]
MIRLAQVGIGGFVGAIARYALSGLTHRWTSGSYPVGTLVVNVLGCLAIGVVMGLIEDKNILGPNARLSLAIGFLGSFTTMSSLCYETVGLYGQGQLVAAVLNAAGNFVLGIGAVVLGRTLVHMVL